MVAVSGSNADGYIGFLEVGTLSAEAIFNDGF